LFSLNQNKVCYDVSGCLILTFMEPISSYSGGNLCYLQGSFLEGPVLDHHCGP
jgi:hypothetical protein